MHGNHCIRTWSSTQATRAVSSGEAEFYAIVEGGSRGIGLKALGEDLGCKYKVTLYSDASAGRGMVFRKGAGRVRHLETKFFWIQDAVREGKFQLLKVKGKENPADVGTKYLSLAESTGLLEGVGVMVRLRR